MAASKWATETLEKESRKTAKDEDKGEGEEVQVADVLPTHLKMS